MTTRLIALSDLHIASPGPLCNFHTAAPLAALLKQEVRPDTTLLLNGDIFDLLQTPGRPQKLDMARAPELLATHLHALAKHDTSRLLLAALADALRTCELCIILPGNHDPELNHPDSLAVLRQELGLANTPNLILHNSLEPWHTAVGRFHVVVGHGHRGDRWNDIAPTDLRRAVATAAILDLPPGSRLVTQILDFYRLAKDPISGKPRFPFVDMLKPEIPAVPLLLMYLDMAMAKTHLLPMLGLTAQVLRRKVGQIVRRSPTLGPGQDPSTPTEIDDEIAESLVAALEPALRQAPDTVMHQLEGWLGGTTAAAPGMLAAHSGMGRRAINAFLRGASQDGTFFQRSVARPC